MSSIAATVPSCAQAGSTRHHSRQRRKERTMPKLTLYAAPMSSATPVLTAVAELGVDCEIVMLDLAAGEQKRPEYLKLNPNGWVPTLVVDGTPMFEAAAILQWL